jgi:hypothetical protein
MIVEKRLPATPGVIYEPWEIPVEVLDSEEIQKIVSAIKNRTTRPQKPITEEQQTMFSIT